jgi:hypothetical protein
MCMRTRVHLSECVFRVDKDLAGLMERVLQPCCLSQLLVALGPSMML